jgi:transposase
MNGGEWTPSQRRRLEQELSCTRDAGMLRRLLALIHVGQGQSISEVARWLQVDRRSIYRWLGRFTDAGKAEALEDHRGRGRRRIWSDELASLLQTALAQSPRQLGYPANTWTVSVLHAFLAVYLPEQEISLWTVRRRLKEMGYVWKRFRYVLAPDPEAEKKTPNSGANSRFAASDSPFGRR